MNFNLDDLKKNLSYFSKKFGDDFVASIGSLLDNCDDIESLERSVNDLFLSEGTNYYMATAEAKVRLSSPTGTDQPKRSENEPIQNEVIEVVRGKIDTFRPKGESADDGETEDKDSGSAQ